MNFNDFCSMAQSDQNTHFVNHLYANLRHSYGHGLVGGGLESFRECLDMAKSRIARVDTSKPDSAAIVAEMVIDHIPYLSTPADFRLSGPKIIVDPNQIFVSLRRQTVSASPATRGSAGGTLPIKPDRITWLTTVDSLLAHFEKLEEDAPARETHEEFFAELVDVLGLRPYEPDERLSDIRCELYLCRLPSEDAACRPNAFSGGYADRFCGAADISSPYGATADNRSGEMGVPEAVIKAAELVPIPFDSAEYEEFKSKLAELCGWVGHGRGSISGVVYGEDLYQTYDYANRVQPRIIQRLGEQRTHCSRGDARCICFPPTAVR